MEDLCFSLLEWVQGQWAWSQMGVHDVRVTVLDLPLVSGVQGEEGMGTLHCPTCMGAPPVTLPWFNVGQRFKKRASVCMLVCSSWSCDSERRGPPSLPPNRDPSSYLFHSSCLLLPLLSLLKAFRGEGTLGWPTQKCHSQNSGAAFPLPVTAAADHGWAGHRGMCLAPNLGSCLRLQPHLSPTPPSLSYL